MVFQIKREEVMKEIASNIDKATSF